jgi:hypothetical protein
MRPVLLAVVLILPSTRLVAADDFTAEKAKQLIPEAAGMPGEGLRKLGEEGADPSKFDPPNGTSLTWFVLTFAPAAKAKEPTSFRFHVQNGAVNPAKVIGAIAGPKDQDGKFRETATLIQPEYITDCTCKVDGNTATGTVGFKAEKVYEGKVEYTARKRDGTWRIEEFHLRDMKVTLVLGADGKWVKK